MAAPGTGQSYAVAQSEIGLAIEQTRGTAAAPTMWVPVKAPKYKPDQTMIPDETLQGSMVLVQDLVRGLRYDGHGWDSQPYLDTFPLFVRAELGSADTLLAASASTTLAAAAAAGATTVSTTATVTADGYIVIGSGATLETHKVLSVSGSASPYTATLAAPLLNAQPAGAVVTGLTSHTFSLANQTGQGDQPPSVTITDFDGDVWRQLTASQLDELTIKGNATGLVDYTCSWFANPATIVGAPSVSFSDEQAVPGWTFYAEIGGQPIPTIVDWEIDLKRGVKPVPALTGGSGYFQYFAGPITATGKLTFVEQSNSPYLAAYLAGTKESLDLTMFDLSSGAAMNIHSTSAMYKTGELDRSKEWVEVTCEVQLLPTAADATAGGKSPVQITVANSQATTY